MFKRLLVPLDGSSRAEYALPVAARIARASSGSIHILRVVSSPIDYGGGLAEAPLLMEQMIESEMDVTTSYLQRLAALPLLEGIQITTEAAFGIPAQYILASLESQTADLIVLCSHGRTGFARWALGSVAHTLAHESTVPALILRENEPASLLSHPDAEQPLCTLVPLDGSQLAESALVPAAYLTAALAAPAQGALHLAQVVKHYSETAEEGFVSELNEEAIQRARAYLATTREHLLVTMKDLKLSLTYSVEFDKDVASVLVSLAEYGSKGKANMGVAGCDMIAISTHGRSGLERWVMGSVTERVLGTTRLPVLIVRPPNKG